MLFFTNRLTMIGWCVIAVLLSWDKVNPRMNLGRWQAESCGVTCYNSSKTILNSIILMILYYAFSLWPHSLYGIVFLIHLSHHRTVKRKKSSHLVTSGLGCRLLANITALLHIWCQLIKNYNGFSAGTECANDIWG